MPPVLLLAALAFFAFYLAGRVSRGRRAGKTGDKRIDPLEHHVEEQIALIVGDELDLDDDAMTRTLRAEPDPDVVAAIEKHVKRVEMVFEKRPGSGAQRIDLSVEVLFEDGRLERRIDEVSATWLPRDVENQLASSGAARAHAPWLFPWQRAS